MALLPSHRKLTFLSFVVICLLFGQVTVIARSLSETSPIQATQTPTISKNRGHLVPDRFILKGILQINGTYSFSIFDTVGEKSQWIQQGEDLDGFTITSYNLTDQIIHFIWKGKSGTLGLAEASDESWAIQSSTTSPKAEQTKIARPPEVPTTYQAPDQASLNRQAQTANTTTESPTTRSTSVAQKNAVPIPLQRLAESINGSSDNSQIYKAQTEANNLLEEMLKSPDEQNQEPTQGSKDPEQPQEPEAQEPTITLEEVKRILGIEDEPAAPPPPFILP